MIIAESDVQEEYLTCLQCSKFVFLLFDDFFCQECTRVPSVPDEKEQIEQEFSHV
jgi:hypothetical protein